MSADGHTKATDAPNRRWLRTGTRLVAALAGLALGYVALQALFKSGPPSASSIATEAGATSCTLVAGAKINLRLGGDPAQLYDCAFPGRSDKCVVLDNGRIRDRTGMTRFMYGLLSAANQAHALTTPVLIGPPPKCVK